MRALVYHGPEDVRVEERPKPVIGGPGDALVRVTNTTICGSDLHLYHGDIPDTREGDVFGHEFMGVVEEVGPEVRTLHPGDRVVVAAVIADGTCWFCQHGQFSLCDGTNPNPVMQEIYGQSIAGVFGYSHLVGGYDGGQAEYVRVPYADVGCLKVPEELRDEQVLFLSDILCTGWMAAENGGVGPGQTVAVFGCGPVGLMAMASARIMGAQRIIAIDRIGYRLDVARERFRAETINYDEDEPVKTLRELTHGRGPDVCIDATGFRYARSLRHRVQKRVKLESDAIDALSDAIRAVRKGGTVSIIGDYIGFANQFPIGAVMEKGLTLRSGQVHVQRYWRPLLERIQRGELDPTFVITHRMPLDRAPEAYRLFDRKADGVLKVLLEPGAA
ncbi:MAG TPA: zinc-dependent alcohol dehydrogenase [Dehalococcoidia bacterium]